MPDSWNGDHDRIAILEELLVIVIAFGPKLTGNTRSSLQIDIEYANKLRAN